MTPGSDISHTEWGSPRHSPGSLDLGTEGSAGWIVHILEGGTITMLLWGVLKRMWCLKRGQQGPLTPSKATPALLPALSKVHPHPTLQL